MIEFFQSSRTRLVNEEHRRGWTSRFAAILLCFTVLVSWSAAVAQELERKGSFKPTGDDYIVELSNFDRFIVGDKVGDGDDVGEMHRIQVDLSTDADRFYDTQSTTSKRAQTHSLVQKTGQWKIRPGDRINRFPHNETLAVHAPSASKVTIEITAKERDCTGDRACGRGDSGRTFLIFEVPTFGVALPRVCTAANTFKLNMIDNNWHLGPVPMRSGEGTRTGPHLSFDPAYPPSICIRKPGGPADISAVLYNQARGVCASHQSNPGTGYRAFSLSNCNSPAALFNGASDQRSNTAFYLQNLKNKNAFFVSDAPVTFDRNSSTCMYEDPAYFRQSPVSQSSVRANYCDLKLSEQILWEHGEQHSGSISNDKGQCLSTASATAQALSLESCRDRANQIWTLAIPYRLYARSSTNVRFSYHAFRPSQ